MSRATVTGTLEAALEYVRRGWLALPLHSVTGGRCTCGNADCGNVGKHPRTEHGVKDATSDEETIRRWWERWPDANVGVATGPILALDVDPRHGGDPSLAALEQKYGTLPATLESRTGGGGRHFFFAPCNAQIIRNSAGKLGPGLDVRGEGGYVVFPPSLHRSGNQYQWANESDPAPLPEWLAKKLAEPEPLAPSPNDSEWRIPEGQRNAHLASLAGTMRRRGMSAEAIEAALLEENRRHCEPPLPENEVRKIAASVGRYEPYSAQGVTNWPEPAHLGDELIPVPAFDLELLPSSFRPLVVDISERMQTPPDYAAAAVVVALAGCVSRRAGIRPKALDRSWVVVPNLWGAIIAPPGYMKSPVLRSVTLPLTHIEEQWRTEHQQESEAYETEKEMAEIRWQAKKEQYKAACKKAVDAKNIPERPAPEDTIAPPAQKRLILTDSTFEKLHEILSDNPAGVLVLRDELTGWLAGLDRQGREQERAFFLESWNGDSPFTVDRIGRGSVHVPAACVSLLGNIQPSRLRSYLSDAVSGGPGDDGLFQRFQVLVWPDANGEWALVDRTPDFTALAIAEKVFARMAQLSAETPVQSSFAPDAQNLFFDWWAELEGKIRGETVLPPAMVAHLSKYRSLMPSLSLLFELADLAAADGIIGEAVSVSLDHARQAAAFCDYLESHARRVYACITSPETRAARDLARHIRTGDLPNEFRTRDVYLKGWSGLDSPERVRSALALLEDAGWVRRAEAPASSAGGRPSEVWNVNPKVIGHA